MCDISDEDIIDTLAQRLRTEIYVLESPPSPWTGERDYKVYRTYAGAKNASKSKGRYGGTKVYGWKMYKVEGYMREVVEEDA